MLRRKITKNAFEGLNEALKGEYKPNPKNDAEYYLDVDDASELNRAVERQTKRADDAEANALQASETIKTLEQKIKDGSAKMPDVEALEKSWQKKLDKAELKGIETVKRLQHSIVETLVEGNAKTIATEISTVPGLMSRAIRDRLSVEFDGDTPHLRVLGADGKPSAATLDELKQEMLANKEYAAIVIASKASGGNAPAPKGVTTFARPGLNAMADGTQQPQPLSAVSPKALAQSDAIKQSVEARRAQRQGS